MTTFLAQQDAEPQSEHRAAPAPPAPRRARRRPRLSGRLLFSIILLGCILVFAILGPLLMRSDPLKIVGGLHDHPSPQHLLGTAATYWFS
jgi:hypothetical protein